MVRPLLDSLQLSTLAQSSGLSGRASGWGLGLLSLGKQSHLTILPAGQPEGDLVLAGWDLAPVLFCINKTTSIAGDFGELIAR